MDIFFTKKKAFFVCLFVPFRLSLLFFGMDSQGKVKDRTLLFVGFSFLYLKK